MRSGTHSHRCTGGAICRHRRSKRPKYGWHRSGIGGFTAVWGSKYTAIPWGWEPNLRYYRGYAVGFTCTVQNSKAWDSPPFLPSPPLYSPLPFSPSFTPSSSHPSTNGGPRVEGAPWLSCLRPWIFDELWIRHCSEGHGAVTRCNPTYDVRPL